MSVATALPAIAACAALLATAACATPPAPAVPTAHERSRLLLRADIDDGTRKVYVASYELAPGARSERHSHPGDEFVYVLAGEATVLFDDGSTVSAKAGAAFHVAAGVAHVDLNLSATEMVKVIGVVLARPGQPINERTR